MSFLSNMDKMGHPGTPDSDEMVTKKSRSGYITVASKGLRKEGKV